MENIDIMIVLAQIVNFLIIFFIFKKFIANPLNETLLKRRELLAKLASADEEYAAILENAKSEQTDILMKARKDAEKLLRDMEELSKVKGSDILQAAEKRADSIIASGKRNVEKERIYMMWEMKEKILDLALKLNEKLLDSADTKTRKFLQKELDMLV